MKTRLIKKTFHLSLGRSYQILVMGALAIFTFSACSSFLKYEKSEQLKTNDEFSNAVKIQSVEEAPVVPAVPTTTAGKADKKNTAKLTVPRKAVKVKGKTKAAKEDAKPLVRQPDIEDTEGFAVGQRRPLVDPVGVGEVVTHAVTYMGLSAGEVKFKVEPFQIVNGRKSYTFATEIKTAGVFSNFYSVDDRVETLVDFEDLTPRAFSLHVKESGQLREARSFFDNDKLIATYWEKKVTKKSGVEEKKQSWEILPFSQNVYSAIFYMRMFKWEEGKEYSFRVADDEQNIVFKGKVVRREEIETDAGKFKAIVIKPEITVKGAFKPIGDIFFWLSDDEHKYVLRIESKIKIGTLASEAIKITPGKSH